MEVLLSQCHPICSEVNGLELLWIEMKINALTFFCDVCYGPPCVNAQANINFLTNLQCSVDRALSIRLREAILMHYFKAGWNVPNHIK